jgi:hypothetical protein
MLDESRAARRTDLYVEALLAADGPAALPADLAAGRDDEAADVRLAGSALRAGLVRVHPSFRFEEALAGRLAAAALRLRAGLPIAVAPDAEQPASSAGLAAFPVAAESAASEQPRPSWSQQVLRLPAAAAGSRPLIFGGVGVASAAISLGAVYVAWRHSGPARSLVTRAVRAVNGRTGGGPGGPFDGIAGTVS